jgi:hypothetical protein
MPFVLRWSKFAGKMSDTFPAGDIIWDKADQTGWEFRHQTAPTMRIEWGAIKVWKDIIPVTKQSLGTVDYPFRNIWGDMIYANLLASAPQVSTNSLSLGQLSSDPGLLEGLLWYRSDLKRVRYYDGVFSRSLVHTDEFNSHASRHAAGGADPITSPLPLSAIPPLLQPYREFYASSTVSYVDFTDLDINTHKAYVIIGSFKNPLSVGNAYRLFVEGDYAATNYYNQFLEVNGTSVGGARENSPNIAYADAGERVSTFVYLVRDPDGYVRYGAWEARLTGGNIKIDLRTGCKTATVTNITSIRIDGNNANGIGTGSRIMLFRFGG